MSGATQTTAGARAKSGQNPFKKYATAATIGLFAIVGISGVLIFFHIGNGLLMGAHEWLGLAFVAASGLHVARNWKGFSKAVKAKSGKTALALTAFATTAFILASTQSGGNPMKEFVMASAQAPLPQVAQVLNVSLDDLIADLKTRGFMVIDPTNSPAQIAKTSGREVPEVFKVIVAARN